MKSLFLIACFLIQTVLFSQNKSKVVKPLPGAKVTETINCFKDSETPITFELPNNAFNLIYRYSSPDGTKDNYDSLYEVVNHIYRLNRYFGPRRKPSRIVCAIYTKKVDAEALALKQQITTWASKIGDSLVKTERAGFNFNRPFQFLFITEDKIKPTSVLNEKLDIVAADGSLLWASPIKSFKFSGRKGTIKGKILTESQGKKAPVPNAMVSVLNTVKNESDSALTDAYGDFELGVPDENTEYSIVVRSQAKEIDNLILATQSGQEISKLKKTSRGFEYKLIPNEVIKLTEMDVNEDITLTFSKFKSDKSHDLKVTENILYPLAQYKVEDADSKATLDKVVKILKENLKVKLEVISHTDAQGDDVANMALSEKRSAFVIDYFVSKGIDRKRLSSIGRGETEIRNRCVNGIDCSDKEHEYNRRTEFKFSKD
jgi:outer membrane protein OmpA-like peptidoglycan-associated protein